MQVYIVKTKGEKIDVTEVAKINLFRNFSDIEPSFKTSYFKAANLKVEKRPTSGPIEFVVSGDWPLSLGPDLGGQHFEEIFQAIRVPVWDSPTHL